MVRSAEYIPPALAPAYGLDLDRQVADGVQREAQGCGGGVGEPDPLDSHNLGDELLRHERTAGARHPVVVPLGEQRTI